MYSSMQTQERRYKKARALEAENDLFQETKANALNELEQTELEQASSLAKRYHQFLEAFNARAKPEAKPEAMPEAKPEAKPKKTRQRKKKTIEAAPVTDKSEVEQLASDMESAQRLQKTLKRASSLTDLPKLNEKYASKSKKIPETLRATNILMP